MDYLKISNNVSNTSLLIVAKFQINSVIIFEVIKKSFMPDVRDIPPDSHTPYCYFPLYRVITVIVWERQTTQQPAIRFHGFHELGSIRESKSLRIFEKGYPRNLISAKVNAHTKI